MEQTKLMEINNYLTKEYDKTDEDIYSMIKMYYEGDCNITELYNFLEGHGLLYPLDRRTPGQNDVTITEEDLKYYIKNKVLNISKDEEDEN